MTRINISGELICKLNQVYHVKISNIPVKRFGEPEEIARAVIFLVADESSFITRKTLSINGEQNMA